MGAFKVGVKDLVMPDKANNLQELVCLTVNVDNR